MVRGDRQLLLKRTHGRTVDIYSVGILSVNCVWLFGPPSNPLPFNVEEPSLKAVRPRIFFSDSSNSRKLHNNYVDAAIHWF